MCTHESYYNIKLIPDMGYILYEEDNTIYGNVTPIGYYLYNDSYYYNESQQQTIAIVQLSGVHTIKLTDTYTYEFNYIFDIYNSLVHTNDAVMMFKSKASLQSQSQLKTRARFFRK